MKHVKLGLAAALLGGIILTAPEASAMPIAPIASTVTAGADSGVQEARLVCGPFRCFRTYSYYRRPIFRRYRYYYRRPVIRPFFRVF